MTRKIKQNPFFRFPFGSSKMSKRMRRTIHFLSRDSRGKLSNAARADFRMAGENQFHTEPSLNISTEKKRIEITLI